MSDEQPPPPPAPNGDGSSKNVIAGIIAVIVVIFIGAAIFGGDDSSDSSGSSGGEDDEVMEAVAFDVCKDFVKDRLKSPGSAQFPDYWDRDDEVRVTSSGDRYTVRSHVDSENSFGALLQTRFTCVVEDQGDDTMRLEDLTLNER